MPFWGQRCGPEGSLQLPGDPYGTWDQVSCIQGKHLTLYIISGPLFNGFSHCYSFSFNIVDFSSIITIISQNVFFFREKSSQF